jgi:hypothetical protein
MSKNKRNVFSKRSGNELLPFEKRLAKLTSALSWLIKNHDGNYLGRPLSIDEREADQEEAWDNARALTGQKRPRED